MGKEEVNNEMVDGTADKKKKKQKSFSEWSFLKLDVKSCGIYWLIKWQIKINVSNYRATHTKKKKNNL